MADPVHAVVHALQRVKLIPDVLPESFVPSVLFSIVYPNGAEVNLGNTLVPDDTQDEPQIRFAPMANPWDDTEGATEVSYTLVMLDPDAPTAAEPIYRSFRHWVITGIKSPAASSNAAAETNGLKTQPSTTPYRPSGPRPASGIHRYTFLLFQEPASAEPFVVPQGAPEYGAALEERRSWSAVDFGAKYGLKLVGASYFLVDAS